MSNRALMIALAVSLALNLFAVAAGVTAWVSREAAEDRVEEVRSSRERMPLMAVIDTIDPDRRGPVGQAGLSGSPRGAPPGHRPDRE